MTDLEKEISEWLKHGHITDTSLDDYNDDDIIETAKHFTEWQKEQVFKEIEKLRSKDFYRETKANIAFRASISRLEEILKEK